MDGGSTMGILPKALWRDKVENDTKNRIKTLTRCVFIDDGINKTLIDTGVGNRFDEKSRNIYNIGDFELLTNLECRGENPNEIDNLILSHLHLDHTGCVIFMKGEKEF